jgi:hypothetical protein
MGRKNFSFPHRYAEKESCKGKKKKNREQLLPSNNSRGVCRIEEARNKLLGWCFFYLLKAFHRTPKHMKGIIVCVLIMKMRSITQKRQKTAASKKRHEFHEY